MRGSRDDTDQMPGPRVPDGEPGSAPDLAQPGEPADPTAAGHGPHGHTPLLLDAADDRWGWRRRIRQDPRKAFFYRIGVGLVGCLLIVAGVVTGPLPGPGGIPLVLLGLAVWSSEFEWAQRLMLRFKRLVQRYRSWPRRKRILFWVTFLLTCWVCGYLGMVIADIPPWVPEWLAVRLDRLPGVHRH